IFIFICLSFFFFFFFSSRRRHTRFSRDWSSDVCSSDLCRNARKPNKKIAGPFNYFIEPDPDQLLRVSIAIGFRRARLKYAYAILRGKDLETGKLSVEIGRASCREKE